MDNNQRDNRQSGGGNRGPQHGPGKNNSTFMIFLIVTLVTLLGMALLNNVWEETSSVEITYDEFLDMLDAGQVESVVITSSQLEIRTDSNPLAQC